MKRTLVLVIGLVVASCGSINVDEIAADYPLVDGSTSALPLQRTIACDVYELECEWVHNPFDQNSPRVIAPIPSDDGESPADIDFVHEIWHNGTHGSYVNLIDEEADLILVAREPSPDELATAEAAGVTLDVRRVALDAFVFVVNTDAPAHDLSLETIREIYTGSTTHWDQAVPGAPHRPITTFVRNETSGSQQLMEQLVMRGLPMVETTTELIGMSMLAPINWLMFDELGIGYSVYFYAAHIFPSPDVEMLAIDGVAPTAATIADGSYPLTTDVLVVVRTDTPADSTARALRDWLLTDDGQRTVANSGYVPLP